MKVKKLLLLVFVCLPLAGTMAQSDSASVVSNKEVKKMKVEIWSDIVCPWCYIGKKRFEEALSQVEFAEYIEVEYKSYQLDPQMETDTSISVTAYLSEKKGIDPDQAQDMMEHVSGIAASDGLEYHLDKSIPINTLQAHGLLHYAKTEGKQIELKERLMRAYFTEALNLDDTETLLQLAGEVGLDTVAAKEALVTNKFGAEVQKEIRMGVQMGLRGVPFFVYDRKYAISGAQELKVFKKTLEKAYKNWRQDNPIVQLETIDGKICTPDGKCD